MGILSGNPTNEPMHYGEVFGTWSYLLAAKGMIGGYQVFLNHTGDSDLHRLIEEAIHEGQQGIKDVETLLKENGVGLPPAPPERPNAQQEKIPVGARFQDPEISAAVSKDLAAGLVVCSQIIGQSTREDIAMKFGQMHVQKANLGAKFLRLNKEKGWLVVPPLHQN
ncbi:DUF3231 family protein [Virgibacillus byunsanensis]|uniref:DUF3231 family protein n=1 Tax=Virgibacillus byunsanensis TaxID=570945 RepID=A0ABW3LLF4_9BACI